MNYIGENPHNLQGYFLRYIDHKKQMVKREDGVVEINSDTTVHYHSGGSLELNARILLLKMIFVLSLDFSKIS
jgi:hypothetical protein